jgi:hypothetical protein
MPQSREILTCDSLNDKPAAFGFAAKPSRGHTAARKRDLRCFIEAKRRVMPHNHLGEFSCAHGDALRNASTARV